MSDEIGKPKLITLDRRRQWVLFGLTFVSLIIGAIFLTPYLMLVVFSAIMATLFNPLYVYFTKKGKSSGSASFYTFLASVFVVVIPLIIIMIFTALQVNTLIKDIGNLNISTADLLNSIVEFINNTLSRVGIDKVVTIESLTESISSSLSTLSSQLIENVVSFFSSFFNLITAAIIYIYVFLSMLKNQDKIMELIRKLNPLGEEIADLYISRTGAMTKATVRGQFIIALMQGGESATVLALLGFDNLFFFFLIFLTFMSLIPLGAGIITIPLGIGMILTGNITGGILVIANHLLIVTNIDNVMRPKLVPKSARLDPALMILAVFSGMALFGFLGIVIGPIIMILIVTTVQIYQEVFFKEESIDRTKYEKTKHFARLSKKNTASKSSKKDK